MYQLLPWFTGGATYTFPVTFDLANGEATLNFSAFGLGCVKYNEAKMHGVKWPQQIDVSMAARPTDWFLIALTTSWLNWPRLIRLKRPLPNRITPWPHPEST